MTLLPLFRRSLTDSWRSMLAWTAGVIAILLLYLPLYPSVGSSTGGLQDVVNQLPPALVKTLGYEDLTTGAGYVQSTFFGLIGFVTLTIASIAWGAAAIAGDEEFGTLEVTVAHAVTRTQIVLERTLALLARLVWLGVVAAVVILVMNAPMQLGLSVEGVVSACLMLVAVVASSGCVALAAGAVSGHRSIALATGALVAVFGYVANAISRLLPELQWLERMSPYWWAWGRQPLQSGWDLAGLGALLVLSVVATGIAVLGLTRRDI